MYAFFAPSVHNSRLAALPQSVSRTHRGRKLLAHRARYAPLFTGTPPACIPHCGRQDTSPCVRSAAEKQEPSSVFRALWGITPVFLRTYAMVSTYYITEKILRFPQFANGF